MVLKRKENRHKPVTVDREGPLTHGLRVSRTRLKPFFWFPLRELIVMSAGLGLV